MVGPARCWKAAAMGARRSLGWQAGAFVRGLVRLQPGGLLRRCSLRWLVDRWFWACCQRLNPTYCLGIRFGLGWLSCPQVGVWRFWARGPFDLFGRIAAAQLGRFLVQLAVDAALRFGRSRRWWALGSRCKLVRSRCGDGWRWSGLLLDGPVEGSSGRGRACVRTAGRYRCWSRRLASWRGRWGSSGGSGDIRSNNMSGEHVFFDCVLGQRY